MNILGEGQSEYRIKDELTDHGVFKLKKTSFKVHMVFSDVHGKTPIKS